MNGGPVGGGGQGPKINVGDYLAAKADGTGEMIKVNGVPHFTQREFERRTGVSISPTVPLDRNQILVALAQIKSDMDGMNIVLADMDAAREVMPNFRPAATAVDEPKGVAADAPGATDNKVA
jgi:hypothetical protein